MELSYSILRFVGERLKGYRRRVDAGIFEWPLFSFTSDKVGLRISGADCDGEREGMYTIFRSSENDACNCGAATNVALRLEMSDASCRFGSGRSSLCGDRSAEMSF